MLRHGAAVAVELEGLRKMAQSFGKGRGEEDSLSLPVKVGPIAEAIGQEIPGATTPDHGGGEEVPLGTILASPRSAKSNSVILHIASDA